MPLSAAGAAGLCCGSISAALLHSSSTGLVLISAIWSVGAESEMGGVE